MKTVHMHCKWQLDLCYKYSSHNNIVNDIHETKDGIKNVILNSSIITTDSISLSL